MTCAMPCVSPKHHPNHKSLLFPRDVHSFLQIHDELVFEAPIAEVELVTKLIKTTMENIITLNVPIKVDISHGDNWQEI